MTDAIEFWQDKHRKYVTNEWALLPNFFVEEILKLVPEGARVVDLGAGTGRDSLFLAERDREVVAVDFSPFSLDYFATEARRLGVTQLLLDLGDTPYPFADDSFDVAYAHLSLHYMSAMSTRASFAEVARILKPSGRFFALFNSVRDPEFRTGSEIEPSYFELSPGDRKRYFSVDELPGLLGPRFRIVSCGYGTGTRKNSEDEFVRLIAERT